MFFTIIKKPVTLSIINLHPDLRVFHTNHTYFLRKLISKNSSIDPEAETEYVEKNINLDKPEHNPNANFLGIEGDEGVIVISDHKHSTHTDFKRPDIKAKKEKFYKTTFGIIRNDSQNKLRYHGQYDNKEMAEFPYFSKEQTEVSNIQTNFKLKPIRSFYSDISRTREEYSNKHDGDKIFRFCPNPENYSVKDENLKLFTENKSSNIRDQHTKHKDASFCQGFNVNESKDMNIRKDSKSSRASVSYIDESFFGSAVKEDHDKENIYETSVEDLNYIDQQIFGDVSRVKDADFNKNEKIKMNTNSDNLCSAQISIKDLSNMDKENFENNTPIHHNKVSFNEQYFKEDYHNSNTGNYNNIVEDLGYVDQQMFKSNELLENNNIVSNEQNVGSEKFDQNILTESSTSSEDIIINKFISGETKNSVQDMSAFDTKIPIKYDQNTEKIGSKKLSKSEAFKKTRLNNFDNISNLSHNKPSKQVIDTVEMNNTAFDENTDTFDSKQTNINHVKSKKLLPKMKVSSEATDESNDENKTAYDFVEKLRNEQSIKSIRKAPVLGQDQFDSKGFRILKNQVQDLSNITREEIITILKNNILYTDDDIVILNKPYSLVIHESKTTSYPCLSQFLDSLAKEIDTKGTDPKLYTVHRLDKETTGCLILARNEMAADNIKSLFAQRKIIKKYWILTSRIPDPLKGVIDIPIAEGSVDSKNRMVLDPNLPNDINYQKHSKRGKRAVTAYQVISISGNAALVEVTPETGIKHQIRVHFGFGLSCPIIGDHKYSHLDKMAPQKLASDLLQRLNVRQSKVRYIPMHIHAHSVTIPGYLDGRDLFMMAPLPFHMRANLKKLKFKKKDKLRL